EEKIFIIVGTFETNPNENKISNKSPLGRVLLGKELNEEFEFTINENTYEYEILKIEEMENENI
ncbi:MAG: GreA/GreB family elongation factor, partial [Poseidonibacter sp.]|uniref:GreA/GreB family elongation factor n=1 Tax=Poseidonibacter sp. TaxID=2321188 RepID=UPI00359CE4D7